MLTTTGCSSVEKAKPQPQPAKVDRSIPIDVPEIMRGTIAAETVLLGYDDPSLRNHMPIIVRGYGLVVGLNGTGSRDISPPLMAHMLAQASKGGWGQRRYSDGVTDTSPRDLINSSNTAVVVVEGIVPQGAVKGTRFDVRVMAERGTGTESLEGGILYTTELRPGGLRTGGGQAFALAEARGPIFVNPFAEPNAVGRDTVDRTIGRILDGGTVLKDIPLKLRLANPNHMRAAVISTAINTRFPQEPSQRYPTARGESDESIELTVPPSWADRTVEFLELLRHTTISQVNTEAVAMSVKRTVLSNPMVAEAAAMRWHALGPKILPLIRDLYTHAEELPRMAALYAGGKLDDPLAIPHLIDMAQLPQGSGQSRQQAMTLLAGMSSNPQIDYALRDLLKHNDVETRLEAYEALVKRGDPFLRRVPVDRKFILDIVDSDKPMVYVTQLGQPRIVLFGNPQIQRPVTMQAWSNRLMIKGDEDESLVEVYYRPLDAEQGYINQADPSLEQFIRFLAHTPSVEKPAPGLGLTYSETVSALYQIWSQKHLNQLCDFKAEQDRILAAIIRQEQGRRALERPEFDPVAGASEADDVQPDDAGGVKEQR